MKAGRQAVTLAVLTVLLSASALAGQSGSRGVRIGWHVHQPTRFMVSGVLRKDGATDVIKPVHTIVAAETGDAAVESFTNAVKREYPGYALIATLASPVPSVGTRENAI